MERVYVANLPPDIRIKDIDDFFRPFGKLVYIDVNHQANPVHAYVQFDSARNAFNAVKSRHGYDYEGYTLQLRLMENDVRKRRDAIPPPPPPLMFDSNERKNNDSGYNNNYGSYNRMSGNFPNSLIGPNFNSWSNNDRDVMQQQQNMPQYSTTMLQRNMMDPAISRSNVQQQYSSIMPYASNGRLNIQQQLSNTNRSNINKQYSNSDRLNMQPSNGRSNIQQQYSNINRSNIQQQCLNSDRLNLQQQYSNSDRLNMQQQYSSSDRLNMQQQYSNSNRSNILQHNNNYSNTNRSNIPQQQNMNSMDYSNNNSWNSANNGMDWNSGNYGNGDNHYNNFGRNEIFNRSSDHYATKRSEESYTRGLSGSGRKWFSRYIRKGFSPEMARIKALEHKTVPYRSHSTNNQIPNDSTNVALETIGNTILSFLSTNPVGPNNFEMIGPSTSKERGIVGSQVPVSAVSRQQYIKSLNILKRLSKSAFTAEDRISRKYHKQIVKDYQLFRHISDKTDNVSTSRKVKIDTTVSEAKLSEKLRKKKRALLMAAKRLRIDPNKRFGAAYKKRMKILMNESGFSELEAKALAVHPIENLKELMSIKKEYDMVIKKTDFISVNKTDQSKTPKIEVYRNDIKYVNSYEKHKISNLSPRIKTALRACIARIHKYEKESKLPLTESKFISLLQQKSVETKATKNNKNEKSLNDKSEQEVEKKDNKKPEAVNKRTELKENSENTVDNQNSKNIVEEQYDIADEQFEDVENPKNGDDND